MANSDSGWSFATGFFMGAVVGAVAGILLAPKSGLETRTNIIEQSEAWRGQAEEMAAKVREKVGPTLEGVRERMGPAVEEVRGRVTPVAERVASRTRRRRRAAPEPEEETTAETTTETTEA